MQAAARVLGNDATLAFCGASGGQFQLNVMMPVMADRWRWKACRFWPARPPRVHRLCLAGMAANARPVPAEVEKSMAMATGLNPYLGYEKAAALAKEALASGKTVRELCREKQILPEDAADEGPRSLADDAAGVTAMVILLDSMQGVGWVEWSEPHQ